MAALGRENGYSIRTQERPKLYGNRCPSLAGRRYVVRDGSQQKNNNCIAWRVGSNHGMGWPEIISVWPLHEGVQTLACLRKAENAGV